MSPLSFQVNEVGTGPSSEFVNKCRSSQLSSWGVLEALDVVGVEQDLCLILSARLAPACILQTHLGISAINSNRTATISFVEDEMSTGTKLL